jgi:hypothetical protein
MRRVSVTWKPYLVQLQVLSKLCAHYPSRGICSRGPEEYNKGGYCQHSLETIYARVICALFSLLASACTVFATARVTLVLQFDAAHSEQSVSEMKSELQSLMRDAGVELNWRRIDELSSSDSFPSVVVVTFHGSCEMKPFAPPLPSEPVALASTRLQRPNNSVRRRRMRPDSQLAGGACQPGSTGDLLFGRAMGRVLAHELHHIIIDALLIRSAQRKSLSPRSNRRRTCSPPRSAATNPVQFKVRYLCAKTNSMF